MITEEIDGAAAALLHQLLQWQERARAARDARSAQRVTPRKRLVSGLRCVNCLFTPSLRVTLHMGVGGCWAGNVIIALRSGAAQRDKQQSGKPPRYHTLDQAIRCCPTLPMPANSIGPD